jgi:hypothetical protein
MSSLVVHARRENGKIIRIPGYFDEDGNQLSEEAAQEAIAELIYQHMINDKEFFNRKLSKSDPVTSITSEWFWKENVQATLIRYLTKKEWLVEPSKKVDLEDGLDVKAIKNGQKIWARVYGYPSKSNIDGNKKRQFSIRPNLLAEQWFEGALHFCIQKRGNSSKQQLLIAFPDFKRYRVLIKQSEWVIHKMDINVLLVKEDGSVDELIGNL